jgi:hypothetical protein
VRRDPVRLHTGRIASEGRRGPAPLRRPRVAVVRASVLRGDRSLPVLTGSHANFRSRGLRDDPPQCVSAERSPAESGVVDAAPRVGRAARRRLPAIAGARTRRGPTRHHRRSLAGEPVVPAGQRATRARIVAPGPSGRLDAYACAWDWNGTGRPHRDAGGGTRRQRHRSSDVRCRAVLEAPRCGACDSSVRTHRGSRRRWGRAVNARGPDPDGTVDRARRQTALELVHRRPRRSSARRLSP